MALPQLTATDVETIVPNCKVVSSSLGGGQKIVFPCCIDGKQCAVKFILLHLRKNEKVSRRFSIEKLRSAASICKDACGVFPLLRS